jgi:hypothetical protein
MDRKYRLYLKLLEMSGTKPLRYAELSSKLYYSDEEILQDLLYKMQRLGFVRIRDEEISERTRIEVIPGMITFSKHGIMQIQKKRVTA